MKTLIHFFIIVLFLVLGLQAATAQTSPTRLRLKQLELAPDSTEHVITSDTNRVAVWTKIDSVLYGTHSGPLTAGRIPRATGTYTLSDGVLRDDGTLLALGGATVSGYSFYDYSTGAWRLATGTTAQRPGSPTAGAMRYNTDNGAWEYYGASAWEVPLKSGTSTGLGTAGRVFYGNSAGRAVADDLLYWNSTTNQFAVDGLSTNTVPNIRLQKVGATPTWIAINNSDNDNAAGTVSVALGISGGTNQFFDGTVENDLVMKGYTKDNNKKLFIGAANSQVANLILTPNPSRVGLLNTSPSYTLDINATDGIRLPVGTTAQRPTNAAGVTRYNSTNGALEYYGASAWEIPVKSSTATGLGTAGRVFYANSAGRAAADDLVYWNSTTNQFAVDGLSTNTVPNIRLQKVGATPTWIAINNSDNDVTAGTVSLAMGISGGTNQFFDGTVENDLVIKGYTRDNNKKLFIGAAYTQTANLTLTPNPSRVGIGETSPARTLHVTGEARITDLTTDTPTKVVGADADGDLGAVSEGYGINITGGALEVDTTQIATQSDLASAGGPTIYTADATIPDSRTVTIAQDSTLIWQGSGSAQPVLNWYKEVGYSNIWDGWGFYQDVYSDSIYSYIMHIVDDGSGTAYLAMTAGENYDLGLSSLAINSDGGAQLTGSKSTGTGTVLINTNATLGGFGVRVQGTDGIEFDANSSGKFIFQTNNTTRAYLDATGLGINDTSPEKSLDVGGMGKFRQLSGQDNSVTIGTNANAGTGRSASITDAQSSDVAGRFSFTTGTTLTAGEWITLTWGTSFDNPPAVVLMPENANAASIVPYLYVVPSTAGCSIVVNVTGVPYEGLTYEFNYIVIQGK